MSGRPTHNLKGQARLAPFSLRLTADERTRLEREAAGQSLAGYIKAHLFADALLSKGRRQLPVRDQRALAQALGQLGRSELMGSVRDLAEAVRSGSLVCDGEVRAALLTSCDDINAMRVMLVAALGLKPRSAPPPPFATPRHAEHSQEPSRASRPGDPQGIAARRGQSACRPSAQ